MRWCTLLVVACAVPAQDDDRFVAKGRSAQRLAAAVERCGDVGFSGAVLAARGGKVQVALGVGSADLEDAVPNTANTLFEIASASKQFTAAAVCALVDRKKLKLDDPIAKHLPGIPKDCEAITVRHLLQHTSGIPGSNSKGHGDDLAAVLPLFLDGGPRHEPGTHWEYWNQGYALLTEIIARASGQDFTEFSRSALFRKADLKITCFTGDDAPKGAVVAVGRAQRGPPRSALEHPYGSFGFQYRGMGGVVSNVWDLWRWDRALHGKKLLKKSRAELFEPGLEDYALGWYVKENRHGRLVHEHSGSVRGFVCMVRRFPQENGCLFVLSNRDDAPVHSVVELLERVLFEADVDLPPAALAPDVQATLVGSYRDARGARLVVEAAGAVTRARIEWGAGGPVTHAVLGTDEHGDVALFDWAESQALGVTGEPAERIELRGQRFEREPL